MLRKNILLIDSDYQTILLMNILSEIDKEFNVISVLNFDDGIAKYKSNPIELVIVDFSVNENNQLFTEILKINPKQNTITLSDKIACCSTLGCQSCIENFNNKRLIKPVNAMQLHSLLNNFNCVECKYYNDFDHIETIMPDIVKRFIGCAYDTEKKIIQFKNNGYHTLQSMITLSSILDEHSVYYKFIDEFNVQIDTTYI
ncbi:MAG: hypothetical protein Q7U69_04565 [Sulfuricurvum sp.]|uniref:hypothetical protein n=2 Tax=Sulfuricurvum sp. TaxID=2025608 RepID=UPI0027244928|nr:hypothetical protein [Sulfuricurvum sp.]MDO9055797.1 hypothetical protein [Sulfuricurvum sp.]